MKFILSKNSITRKILIVLLMLLTLTFAIMPNYNVYADTEVVNKENLPDEGKGIIGTLLKQLIQVIDSVSDIVMGVLNKFMLGTDGFTSTMLSKDNSNITDENSWLYAQNVPDNEVDFEFGDGTIDTSEFIPSGETYQIPNFLYSPEAIFSNNIAALDVNFLNPNEYTAVSDSDSAQEAAKSGAGENGLQKTIADWYISFRNIAIVGLLSVLIYLGIRIVISSTAGDKAKYKENLQNWVVALCLVFFIHFIMSGLLMITDQVNDLFDETANNGIVVKVDSGNIKFRTNLIGYVRFSAQSKSMYNTVAYSLLYMVLVIYTCVFTVMYFKRFLYMAFLTMIAPLVALTYPMDKAGDSKAQAFNMWFKEYVMHLILQPVHLILYVALVSSAMDLVKNNIIYGLVAIGFLIPAEKLIKKMFRLEGTQTVSGIGSFAGGALAMQGFNKFANALGKGKNNGSGSKSNSSSESDRLSDNRIRTQNREFAQSFADDDNSESTSPQLGQGNNNNINNNDDNNDQENEKQKMQGDRQFIENNDNDLSGTDNNQFDFQNGAGNQIDKSSSENSSVNRNTSPRLEPDKHWKRKLVQNTLGIKGIKKTGKAAYKRVAPGLGKIAGAVGGAAVGVAAGVATGDLSNTFKFAGAGALAGQTLGEAAAKMPENIGNSVMGGVESIRNKVEDFNYEKDKAKFGLAEANRRADERVNEREKIKLRNNSAERKKYEEMAGRISQETGKKDIDIDQLMDLGFDYKKAGISDYKQIESGLTMEMKHSDDKNIHKNMVDIVNMTNNYGKDYVLDDKKRTAMQDTIKSTVKNQKTQDKVWDLYTETLGFKNLDKKYGMKR